MSDDPREGAGGVEREPGAPRVRRVDGRLGLAVARASLAGRTLVTYARDHVTVRTPSRPDFRDGNTIDLEQPPAPEDLDRWLSRFDATVARLGATHVRLRWETPLEPSAPADAPAPPPGWAPVCEARGLELRPLTVLLLDDLVEPPAAPAELAAVPAPEAGIHLPSDRWWYAAQVLLRYEGGDDPDAWRDAAADPFAAWSVEVERELAVDGRAQLWLALRHGSPVGRLSVIHDRQGLAAVESVVVHPAHRRLGIASALTHAAVRHHLDVDPDARVGLVAEPGSSADRLYRRLGFVPHATLWQVTGPGGGHGERRR